MRFSAWRSDVGNVSPQKDVHLYPVSDTAALGETVQDFFVSGDLTISLLATIVAVYPTLLRWSPISFIPERRRSNLASSPPLRHVPGAHCSALRILLLEGSRVRVWFRGILLLAVLACAASRVATAQSAEDVSALNKQVIRLDGQGKHDEAIALAQRALAVAERMLDEAHPDRLASLDNLGSIFYDQGKYTEAEPLYKRALAIREKALGPDHPDVATSLYRLGKLYRANGHYAEAEALYNRALVVLEKTQNSREHVDAAILLNSLGGISRAQGLYDKAESYHKRALLIFENVLGREHPDVAQSLNDLGRLYQAEGRFSQAEEFLKRALEIRKKVLTPDHHLVAQSLNNLGYLYQNIGRYDDAEALHKSALTIWEKVQGRNHPDVAVSLNNLAELYWDEGRLEEAEPLYLRAVAIREKALGPEHPDIASSCFDLGELYQEEKKYGEAEELYKRALAIREKVLRSGHHLIGVVLNSLADLNRLQGQYGEADSLYQRALTILEKALGENHPHVATSLNGMGRLYQDLGRYAEAEPLYRRALTIRKAILNPGHADLGTSLDNLASLYFVQNDWLHAVEFWQQSTEVILTRMTYGGGKKLSGKRKSEAIRLNWQFESLVKAAFRLKVKESDINLKRAIFETAQWARSSEAAASLAQMAARGGGPKLASLVRERQDLALEWQAWDGLRNNWLGKSPDKRNPTAEAENNKKLADIEARIAEIDYKLAADFPDYASLASPAPLSVEKVQARLSPGEALILFLDTKDWKPTPEETFVWVVTKTNMRWVRSGLGTEALANEVQALRCGLDWEEWHGTNTAARCGALLGFSSGPGQGKPLPFHLGRAYRLYKALFGQIEDMIQGKRLLVVPSGPLASLPFNVLVTAPPAEELPKAFEGYRGAAWLTKTNAVVTLPAVSSLKALRRHAGGLTAHADYIGYGDPVLMGNATCSPPKVPDKCPSDDRAQPAAAVKSTGRATIGGGGRRSAHAPRRGTSLEAVLDEVRHFCRLPDTAYEIKCVGEHFELQSRLVRLGHDATKANILSLSHEGKLATYRVMHFATHGLLSGDVEGTSELALVLTPPDKPLEASDNGLLTASEVAGLKLNADWVVLSACNTAAGDEAGGQGQALSGLARAFFYAGGHALLVSHWPVYSDAAVQLTTRAFGEIKRDPRAGRAEAFQRSMLHLMGDKSQTDNAHPAVWAPFVVVGEGGR